MKSIIIITLIVFYINNMYAQVINVQYRTTTGEENTNFLMKDISSDFGRRADNSAWHRGIDYSPRSQDGDVGFPLCAIVGGTVKCINMLTFKIIVIDGVQYDFGYGHIFEDALPAEGGNLYSNGFVLKKLNNKDIYGILNLNGTPNAISTEIGEITYGNAPPYGVQTNVPQGSPFVPLGTSGGFKGLGHLHLYLLNNITDLRATTYSANNTIIQDVANAKNPLQIVDYVKPTYTILFDDGTDKSLSKLTKTDETTYYAGNIKTSIRVRVKDNEWNSPFLTNSIHAMDIDKVELWILNNSQEGTEYNYIIGAEYESKIHYGGRLGEDRYPMSGKGDPTYGTQIDEGSITQFGIKPHAYNDNNYDDFFFSDFYTRISKNHSIGTLPILFANINSDARYPDGNYTLTANAADVKDVYRTWVKPADLLKIKIDNFRPYIKEIEVFNSFDNLIYSAEWVKTGTNLQLLTNNTGTINRGNETWIKFESSEPLKWLPVVSIDGVQLTYYSNIKSTIWTYKLKANSLSEKTSYVVKITSNDNNDNAVINMPESTPIIALTSMPVRTGSGFSTWANGNDEIFSIYGCSTPEEVISKVDANNSSKTTATSSPEHCDLVIHSGDIPVPSFTCTGSSTKYFTNTTQFGDNCSYYWDFDDGEYSYDKDPIPHTYPVLSNSKQYIVKLLVTNADGITASFNKIVIVNGTDSQGNVAFICDYYEIGFNEGDDEEITSIKFECIPFGLNTNYTYTYKIDCGDGVIDQGYYSTNGYVFVVHNYRNSNTVQKYYPIIYTDEYDGEVLIGSYSYNIDEVTIRALPENELNVTFPNLKTILMGSEFELLTKVYNGRGNHTFIWEVYNNITGVGNPIQVFYKYEPSTLQTEEVNGDALYVVNSSLKRTYPTAGEYLIKLSVNDQFGHFAVQECIINVVQEMGCADLSIMAQCPEQYTFPLNSQVQFIVDAQNFKNCHSFAEGFGKIEWFLDGAKIEPSTCKTISPPDFRKCITFRNTGIHTISANVYPHRGDIIMNAEEYTTTIFKTVSIVNYDEVVSVTNQNEFLTNLKYLKGEQAGSINLGGNGDFILAPGFDYNLEALNEVLFKPGLIIPSGSNLVTRVNTPESIDCGCSGDIQPGNCASFTHTNFPDDAVTIYYKSNNWNHFDGNFDIYFYVDDEYGPQVGNIYLKDKDGNELKSGWSYEGSPGINFAYNAVEFKKKAYAVVYFTNSTVVGRDIWYGGANGDYISLPDSTINESNITSIVNIHESQNSKSIIYPNPSNGIFKVEMLNAENSIEVVEIYDQIGKLVYKQNEINQNKFQLNLSNFSKGIYQAIVRSDGFVEVHKIILD